MKHSLIIDLFAGGGGASTGIELATGRRIDIAINHDPEAIALHTANHPNTIHYCSNVFEVDPLTATKGQPVDLLWASPDCKHFSKAKGGKPVSKKIRSLDGSFSSGRQCKPYSPAATARHWSPRFYRLTTAQKQTTATHAAWTWHSHSKPKPPKTASPW